MRREVDVRSRDEQRRDEDAPEGGEPGQQPSEVVAGSGEDGVSGVAVGTFEEVAARSVLGLGVDR